MYEYMYISIFAPNMKAATSIDVHMSGANNRHCCYFVVHAFIVAVANILR